MPSPQLKSKSAPAIVNDNNLNDKVSVSPSSNELVIATIGYAGSGCTKICNLVEAALYAEGYEVKKIKLSSIIADALPEGMPEVSDDVYKGQKTLERATALQNKGDQLRAEKGSYALASYAIGRIKSQRGTSSVGTAKIAFIIDSIKHPEEINLFREVYGPSFRLIAVHCDPEIRFARLFSKLGGGGKFQGSSESEVRDFMTRDERDYSRDHGQQVIKAFEVADFFVANESDDASNIQLNIDIKRFFDLILGKGFHRPTHSETAMHTAFSIALRSSCLSRQVGAALLSPQNTIISIGSNDVPKFGGGIYLEGSDPDHRCATWIWSDTTSELTFVGCHNTRHKHSIQQRIRADVAAHVTNGLIETASAIEDSKFRDKFSTLVKGYFLERFNESFKCSPIDDITEYSRSIHAEMDCILSAGRSNQSCVGSVLYCTTYPCHNCARHLVSAGVNRVYYIEPYVKSLATELHEVAIRRTVTPNDEKSQSKMEVIPFTGVGHRMYEDFFVKRGELKNKAGDFSLDHPQMPPRGTKLRALEAIETHAASLVT